MPIDPGPSRPDAKQGSGEGSLLRMPVMDGIELSSRLRSSHPRLPILLFSGEKDPDGEVLLGEHCLKNPLTPRELLTAINEAISVHASLGVHSKN